MSRGKKFLETFFLGPNHFQRYFYELAVAGEFLFRKRSFGPTFYWELDEISGQREKKNPGN
jgi:hypothetical protein